MEVYFEVLEKLKKVSLTLKNCDINQENIKEYLMKLNYIAEDIDALQYHINDIQHLAATKG